MWNSSFQYYLSFAFGLVMYILCLSELTFFFFFFSKWQWHLYWDLDLQQRLYGLASLGLFLSNMLCPNSVPTKSSPTPALSYSYGFHLG